MILKSISPLPKSTEGQQFYGGIQLLTLLYLFIILTRSKHGTIDKGGGGGLPERDILGGQCYHAMTNTTYPLVGGLGAMFVV